MVLRRHRSRSVCTLDWRSEPCSIEEQPVVLMDAATLRKGEEMIESCESCNPDGAEIPFDNILDRVTGSDPSVTDYILEQPAKCRIACVRSWRRHSLSLRECRHDTSILSLVRRLLELGLRLYPLRRAAEYQASACKGRSDSQRWL